MLLKAPKAFGEPRRQIQQCFMIDFSPRIHYKVKKDVSSNMLIFL
jgi:hypothetical protein